MSRLTLTGIPMLLADQALARRVEAAEVANGLECVQAMRRLQPNGGATAEEVSGGFAIFAGAGSSLTRVVGLGMDGPVEASELEEMESFYRSHGVAVQIDLCPLADSSVLELLRQRPYRIVEFNTVLVQRLDHTHPLPRRACEVEVREASPVDSRLWGRTVAEGFLENQKIPAKTLDEVETIFNTASGISYLASLHGEPAGGAAMSLQQGLALFYADSTLPEFRNRGVHTALIQERCARARAAGCDLAASSTLPGSTSQRNYERAAFRPAYTRAVLVRDW